MPHLLLPALALALTLTACEPADEPAADADLADRMAQEHEGDVPTATPLTAPPYLDVQTETVAYATVGEAEATGYYAEPADADSAAQLLGVSGPDALPGLVVVHEWWGLNENIRAMAERLAGQGYRVLAVDLYDDAVAEAPEQARQLMQEASGNQAQIRQHVEQAVEYLRTETSAEEVGLLGWCFGGGVALQNALALGDRIDAAVVYYGDPVTDRAELEGLEAPLLGLYGEADGGISADSVRAMESVLQDIGADAEIHLYEGAGHAFANPSGQNYEPEAAEDAWDQTLAFLQTELAGS